LFKVKSSILNLTKKYFQVIGFTGWKSSVRTLELQIDLRLKLKYIRVDNGPEFTSKDFELWARKQQKSITIHTTGHTDAEWIYRTI